MRNDHVEKENIIKYGNKLKQKIGNGAFDRKVLFSFSLPQFPVSRFPFPVSRSRSRSHFPLLLLVKKKHTILRISFFSKTNETNLCKQNLRFSMRGDVFVFLCDCRQTRCRWGEIKDKGACFIFKLNYFLSKGPGDLRVTSFSMESFTNTSLDRQTKGKNFQSKGHFQ